jgi:ligand-binding sensor domain-containing protein
MRTRTLAVFFVALGVVGAAAWLVNRNGAADVARADEPTAPATAAPASHGDPWAPPARLHEPVLYFDRWETLTSKDGLPSDRVTCVVAEGDDLYVGTEYGVGMRRGGKWTTWDKDEGLPHTYVTSVARDRAADVTWVSTIRGLARIVGGKVEVFTQKTSGLANDVVYHVNLEGPRVWCATGAGVGVLDTRTGSWSVFDNENSIMTEPWCYSVAFGPDRAWIGVWAGGVVELIRHDGTWRDYKDTDGELEIDLLRDDGPIHMVSSFVGYCDAMLWQTTYFGVSRFDGHGWMSYTAKDGGLPGDFVVHVAGRGHVGYVATDQGLGAIDGDADVCVAYGRQPDGTCRVRTVKNFDHAAATERTFASAPASDVCTWTQPVEDGIWVATSNGLSRGFAAKDQTAGGR